MGEKRKQVSPLEVNNTMAQYERDPHHSGGKR